MLREFYLSLKLPALSDQGLRSKLLSFYKDDNGITTEDIYSLIKFYITFLKPALKVRPLFFPHEPLE